MNTTTTRLTAAALALALVAGAAAGTAVATHEASADAAPGAPGASATHLYTVHVGDDTAGDWEAFEIDYGDANANASVSHVGHDELTVGVDAGGDDPGATVDAAADVGSVNASDGRLAVDLAETHTLDAGDEIVVVVSNVTNPDATGEYDVTVDVDPRSDGGEASAILSVYDPATVSMADQTTEGGAVTVERATLPVGGYVVAHAADGSVLGHSEYLEAGSHEDVTVGLDEPLAGDAELVAMPHADDGDREYDFPDADRPYLTAAGDPVVDSARVTVEAAETTAAETAAETATAERTEAATTEATTTERATRTTTEGEVTPSTAPGFGAGVAVAALLAAALLALRRET